MSNTINSTSPLVSVIVLAYNHENFIEIALRSVFAQTYRPIEVIVTDDGSKDRTRKILRELEDSFDFIFIENEKNIGITKSLNIALKHARGKYVSLLAGDDYWIADKTSIQIQFMEKYNDVAVCSGNVNNVDAQGHPLKAWIKQKASQISFPCFEDFILLKAHFPAVVIMARKEILLQVGGYDERFFMEDLPLWLKLSSQGFQLAVLPEVLGYYRIHTSNTHKNRGQMFENHLRLLNEYREHPLYRNAIRAVYSRQIIHGISLGWRSLAICIVRGFSPSTTYFGNLLRGIQSIIRYLGGK